LVFLAAGYGPPFLFNRSGRCSMAILNGVEASATGMGRARTTFVLAGIALLSMALTQSALGESSNSSEGSEGSEAYFAALRDCLSTESISWDEFISANKATQPGQAIRSTHRQDVVMVTATQCSNKWRMARDEERRSEDGLRAALSRRGPSWSCALDGGAAASELAREPPSESAAIALAVCEYLIESAPALATEASERLRGCLGRRIAVLEDYVSPASDIADAVSNYCEAEFVDVTRYVALGQGRRYRPTDGPDAIKLRRSSVRQVALTMVLEMRAALRKATSPTPPQPKNKGKRT
jgi:hypothetical protein